MTTQELIEYYASLLIIQYRNKPKAVATIETVAKLALIDQLPLSVQNAYSIGSAVGVQLDILGKYVGVTRNGFGFFAQPITLNDIDFATLIRLAIMSNNSGSSLADIQNLLFTFFPGQILVIDHKNMHMSYLINFSLGSNNLIQLLVTEDLLPRPMGVGITVVIYAANVTKFFGFQTYEVGPSNVSPFNTYSNYFLDRPWFVYSDALPI
jgi:hypothetical protein